MVRTPAEPQPCRLLPGSAASDALLRLLQPGRDDRPEPLIAGCYRLGRDASCELVLEHPAVSRQHALLERIGPHWLLRDSGSTNGLWWKGRRVRQLLLCDGDRIRLAPGEGGEVPAIRFERPALRRRDRLLGHAARFSLIGLAGLSGAGLLLLGLSLLQVPVRGSLATVRGPLVLYDRADRPFAAAEDGRHRELSRLDDYPAVLINALLASEDSRFWVHPGVDPIGTLRALLTNLLGGRVLEGGSTLTQQLARSLYPEQVGQGETLQRKWRELLVALQLEARFSKHDLLLSYLNRVYLGSDWGFEDASRRFFGHPARSLGVEEAALLVGLLPSPNGYDPCLNPDGALLSRNRVLEKMVDSGRLEADAGRRARRRPIRLSGEACRRSSRPTAPFYSDQVRSDLEQLVGADVSREGNFLVDTHLDPTLQAQIEQKLRQWLEQQRWAGVREGAVVALDPSNGGILAIVGGRDYHQSQYNRASIARRQPGSTFKLIPYLVALERGAGPGDPIGCGPLRWRGQLFSSSCGGSLSLQQALAGSSNTAALRLSRRVGLDALVMKARELGIRSPLDPVPGLALGQSEVNLLELSSAYAAVASDGIWHPPTTIRKLTDAELCPGGEASRSCRLAKGSSRGSDRDGASPAGERANGGRRVMSLATARSMQGLLRGVVNGGTGGAAWVEGGAWGKTGTTNDGRDLMFIGYAPRQQLLLGVWLGNDDNSPSRGSSALAAGLWAEIVRDARLTR
ncbi:MAG: transglycosylase domain-containing protein [Synechococcaceae cyanobacterium]|nr:transglycosylase domain-containing protein [Synechococcaceae cyanobacterium]